MLFARFPPPPALSVLIYPTCFCQQQSNKFPVRRGPRQQLHVSAIAPDPPPSPWKLACDSSLGSLSQPYEQALGSLLVDLRPHGTKLHFRAKASSD